jgi:hemerythrin-like domain-containing protein
MPPRKKTTRPTEMEQFDSPVELLEADHAKVKALFDKFEAAGERMTKAKQQLVEDVFMALEVHAHLEEEIFYPAIKAVGGKDGAQLIAESLEEHQVVKTLMADMRALEPSDAQYAAKFTVLMENVRHHIEEEEDEMFAIAEEELADDMERLLEAMLERKQALQAS